MIVLRHVTVVNCYMYAKITALGDADQRFHDLLLAATHNPTFRYCKELVQEAIHAATQGSTLSYVSPTDHQAVATAERIVAALQRKDVEEAQRAMRTHLLVDRPPEQARVFLFVDDGEIVEQHNLQRRIMPAHKHPHNPILSPEFPWEGESVLPSATVLYNQERMIYQLWYHGYRALSPCEELSSLCYATSIDGIHWRKPALGLLFAEETARAEAWESNLLAPWGRSHQGDVTSATVLYDPKEPTARRYQMIYIGAGVNATGLSLAASPDGLEWTPNPENPVDLGGAEPIGDALYALPDPATDRVVAYYRIPRLHRATPTIGRMESQDLRHWHSQQPVLTISDIRRLTPAIENVAYFQAGFGKALDLWAEFGWANVFAAIADYTDRMKAALQAIPGVEVETPLPYEQSGGIVTFRMPGFQAALLCASLYEHERVLVAPAVSTPESIRVSTHVFNTAEECDRLVEGIRRVQQSGF